MEKNLVSKTAGKISLAEDLHIYKERTYCKYFLIILPIFSEGMFGVTDKLFLEKLLNGYFFNNNLPYFQ